MPVHVDDIFLTNSFLKMIDGETLNVVNVTFNYIVC